MTENLVNARSSILKFLNEQTGGQVPVNFEGDMALLEGDVLDSLAIVLLMGHLADDLGVEIDDADFVEENFASLDTLTNFLGDKLKEQAA